MKKLIIGALLALSTAVYAACPQLYPNGVAIAPATKDIVELCNSFYVSHYDEVRHRVVFVSERLVAGAPLGKPTRLGSFRADPRVKNSPQSSAYDLTGYDRGHMAPAEDASTDQEMHDTFLVTNAVPQDPSLNRGKWKQREARIRAAAVAAPTDSFVVTIPVYPPVPTLMAGIPVPNGMWKIGIINKTEQAYYADNTAISQVLPFTKVDWRSIIKGQSR
jgi:endonuclease G